MRRILFLDFDDVLHPATAHFALDDVRLPITALKAAGLFMHVDSSRATQPAVLATRWRSTN